MEIAYNGEAFIVYLSDEYRAILHDGAWSVVSHSPPAATGKLSDSFYTNRYS